VSDRTPSEQLGTTNRWLQTGALQGLGQGPNRQPSTATPWRVTGKEEESRGSEVLNHSSKATPAICGRGRNGSQIFSKKPSSSRRRRASRLCHTRKGVFLPS